MNFNIVNVSMLTVGAIMIYAGVKKLTFAEAVRQLIAISKKKGKVSDIPSGTGMGAGSSFDSKTGKAGGGGGGGGGGSW